MAGTDYPMVLWNRTLTRAKEALCDLETRAEARQLDWDVLEYEVDAGDVVVSMLPGSLHAKVARVCLNQKAHFVCSSYTSPEILELHERAAAESLCFVNEVGLDPGIDHLLAHSLIYDYKNSVEYNPKNKHYFRSYCGGFPKVPNDFKYQFSWSPLGVLKALTSEAQWIEQGRKIGIATPWKAIKYYTALIANGEREDFQAYPNRNSLSFMQEYGFTKDWDTQEFVRGTLRLNGWKSAWQHLFDEIESIEDPSNDQRLNELSNELWRKYAYRAGEADRVVLCVELEVRDPKSQVAIWHQSYDLDEAGNIEGSAMSRLVSLTVSLAVESILSSELPSGVTAAPKDAVLANRWLDKLRSMGESIARNNRLLI